MLLVALCVLRWCEVSFSFLVTYCVACGYLSCGPGHGGRFVAKLASRQVGIEQFGERSLWVVATSGAEAAAVPAEGKEYVAVD